jgi:AraC-like DNA-binding protein
MWYAGPNLDSPPEIAQFGIGLHGHRSSEHYCLHALACLHHYDYAARLTVDGETFRLQPGCATLIPPGANLWYFLEQFPSRHRYVHFRMKAGWDGPGLIEQRLEDPTFRVGQLSDQLAISHNHLNRLFRQERGQTAGGYLQERRLQRARFYLESTDLPPGQIGRRCGYPDPHHFNKWIRRHLGHPPSHWRS